MDWCCIHPGLSSHSLKPLWKYFTDTGKVCLLGAYKSSQVDRLTSQVSWGLLCTHAWHLYLYQSARSVGENPVPMPTTRKQSERKMQSEYEAEWYLLDPTELIGLITKEPSYKKPLKTEQCLLYQ